MKKAIVFLLALFILIINCFPVYAYTETDTTYVNNELKECEDVILDSANRILKSQSKSQIDSEDIDYSKAMKIYVDVNILENKQFDSKTLQTYAETAEYIYYLPIYVDGSSIYLTISKGKEVTERALSVLDEEDIEKLQNLVGKWYVPEIQIYPYVVDYKNEVAITLNENNLENEQVYFFGGISGNIPLVAAICSGDSDVQFKIVKQIKNKNDSVMGDEENKQNNIISYEEIREIALSDGELQDGQMGSVGQNYLHSNEKTCVLIISLLAVIIILSFISMLWVNKKYKEKNYEQEK